MASRAGRGKGVTRALRRTTTRARDASPRKFVKGAYRKAKVLDDFTLALRKESRLPAGR